jgi:predicted amidohydrolase YtcJ
MQPLLDLIIENSDIVTMDPQRPTAQRVGVLHGRIVGLDDQLEGWSARERIDATGACLVPGFIDAHTHLELTGQGLAAADISAASSPEAALRIIAEAASHLNADEWLDVGGYDQVALGRHLTARELDQAAGGRKVWIRHLSSHASVVSQAVLNGLDEDVSGNPDWAVGLFKEADQSKVLSQRLPYSTPELVSLIATAAEQARAQGFTTCVDAGNGGEIALSPIDGAAYLSLLESNQLPVRVQLMPSIDTLSDTETHTDDGFRRALALGIRSGFGSDWLGVVAQKIVLDGGMQVETARLSQPYQGSDNIGVWRQDPQDVVDATVEGHRAGWQMALHAIGDGAVDLAIEAFEKAQSAFPRADARHRIEHGGVIRDDQLPRLASLGVAVVPQPCFIFDFGDRYAQQLGPARTPWLYRGQSLIDHGIPVIGSTDRPLAGDALRGIQTLVDRTCHTGQVIAAPERISVEEALKAYTVNGAWAIRREERLGKIRPGFLADFTMLARNPLRVETSTIGDISVLGTVVDGQPWWA